MNKEDIKEILNFYLKILSYVCLIFLFIFAIFLIFYIITNQIASSKKKPAIMSIFTIVSPSMEPEIKVYDIIVDFKVKGEEDLQIGDIITFYSETIDTGGYTVTHRINNIVEVDGVKRYITKGDNNQNVDKGYIIFDNIVGKVKFKIPALGRLQFFISSKLGWLIIILIPTMGIIIMDIIKLKRIFNIKRQIENIPELEKIENVREKEENKRISALIERVNRFNEK